MAHNLTKLLIYEYRSKQLRFFPNCWHRWCSGNEHGTSSLGAHHNLYFKEETLGIPGIGKSSQELDLRLQFSLRINTFPWQHLAFICSPVLLREGTLGGKAHEPGLFVHSTQRQLDKGVCRLARAPPGSRGPCPGSLCQVRRTEPHLSHSFCLNNDLSFLPSWAWCLVMTMDREDNEELGH